MNALWITLASIAGFLLLIVLLLIFGCAKIRITYTSKPRVVASVLGIRFTLVSDKEKKQEAQKDLSRCRNPQRALQKELRCQRKLEKKALKKKQKAREKAARKAERKKQHKALAATTPSPNLVENLSMITSLIKKLYKVTRGRIGIHVKKMHLSVATGDAAQTAILYGAVVQASAYLLQWIETHFTHIRREAGDMQVRADYLNTKTHVEIDIICSIGLMRAIRIGLSMLSAYRSEKAVALKKAKKRIAAENAAKESRQDQAA